jgi:DNA repair protein RecN (Recombination protein N)
MSGACMLLQLDIHNIALIDEVNIELSDGLNILTGETGAGKSIIIDSINAVLGERVSRDIIRTGMDKALVEAVFGINNQNFNDIFEEMGMEPEEDNTLILSREITQSGRNTCRINGKMVSLSLLKAMGERLIDLHGQHDNQSLLKVDNHIELLDSFGGELVSTLRVEYNKLLEQYREIRARLKSLSGDPGERERKIDLLKFQIDEINKARLKKDEEDDLNKQKLLLANSEKIAASLNAAYSLLSSGELGGRPAVDSMSETLSQLNVIAKLDKDYEDIHKRLQELLYQLEDITEDIRDHSERVEYNPALLEEIEERLDLIYKLKRKYGATIEDIHQYCANSEKQLDDMIKSEETAAMLRTERTELERILNDAAARISAERVKAAHLLESKIGEQLDDLEMKKARFKVDIQFEPVSSDTGHVGEQLTSQLSALRQIADMPMTSPGTRKYTQNGLDKVEFLMSANAGEPLKPLARIASGGEMSRIMLAIKTILAEVDKIPTMIFDEIDNGISGKTAQKVGDKLSCLSRGHQVICVTHLAQIACMADKHFLIEKISEDDNTKTTVIKLEGDGNVREIARLIGGETSSETSLRYAKEMLNSAKKLKKT